MLVWIFIGMLHLHAFNTFFTILIVGPFWIPSFPYSLIFLGAFWFFLLKIYGEKALPMWIFVYCGWEMTNQTYELLSGEFTSVLWGAYVIVTVLAFILAKPAFRTRMGILFLFPFITTFDGPEIINELSWLFFMVFTFKPSDIIEIASKKIG